MKDNLNMLKMIAKWFWRTDASAGISAQQSSNAPIVEPKPLRIRGSGALDFEVVGESFYQPALAAVARHTKDQSAETETVAVLVCEDSNPHDSNAVAVLVNNRKVAHLSRQDAIRYRRAMRDIGLPREIAFVNAVIVGGWDYGNGDSGMYGIKLDMELPPAFMR